MFVFTRTAEKALNKIDASNKEVILYRLKKIKEWKISWDFSKLHNFWDATHRLRIGDYRLILKKEESGYIVLDIWHRQSIYKLGKYSKLL